MFQSEKKPGNNLVNKNQENAKATANSRHYYTIMQQQNRALNSINASVQQSQGLVYQTNTTYTKAALENSPVNDSPTLEQEADVTGKRVAEEKTVEVSDKSEGIQKKEDDKKTENQYESYKSQTFALSKDAKLSTITEKEGKETIKKIYEKEKKFNINSSEIIPKGLKVKFISNDFSYEESGKSYTKKEVAKMNIVDSSDKKWHNKIVWTSRTNISKGPNKNGQYEIVDSQANTRMEGVEINGKQKAISKDTKIKLTDYKTTGNVIYVRAINEGTGEDYGWVKAKDLGEDIYNESFGLEEATYISEATNHSTINRDATKIYKQDGYHFPPIKDGKKDIKLEKGANVIICAEEGDYVEVNYLDVPGHPIGWTARSNLKYHKKKGYSEVINSNAILRARSHKYVATGKTLSAGQFIVEKERNHDYPEEKYTKVSLTEKKDDSYVEKTDSEVWIESDNLTSKWADAKGKHATWEKINNQAVYTGQIDLVKVMSHKMKYIKSDNSQSDNTVYKKYNEMVSAAKSAGNNIKLYSGFRTFQEQNFLYQAYKRDPKKYNPAYSPGKSDHQNGIAIDINNKDNSNLNIWLMKNSYKYGFVRTYKGYKEGHHWEFRPEKTRQPQKLTVDKKSSTRYFFATFTPEKVWNSKDSKKWNATYYEE